jgi:CHAT domain-containing protein
MGIPLIKILCATSMMILPIMPAAHAQFTFGQGAGKSQQQPSDGRSRSNQPSPFSIFDHFNFTKERSKSSPDRPRPESPRSPRELFEDRFAQASPEDAVREFETLQQTEFAAYTQTQPQSTPNAAQISRQLAQIAQETGTRPAVLYAIALKKQTHLLLVLPASSPFAQAPPQAQQAQYLASTQLLPGLLAQNETPPVIRQVLPEVSRETVLDVAKSFRQSISNPTELDSTKYLNSAQQLYRWIVKPLEPQLQADKIDTLLFSMDEGLRTIPLGALHNGQQFLVERYSTALIPSFGLTNTNRSLALKQQPMLAMGISKSTEGHAPLPAVPAEISAITSQLWTGPSRETLDEASTLDNLKQLYQQQRFGVLHLATHAVFNPGQIDNSYIQFWNDRLTLSKIRRLSTDLRWNQLPSLELLVLSACQTALGNKEAELGFAGTAINAGVPAAIASLWAVEDRGTFGLMTGFYDALQSAPTKAKALQQAQIRMLRGEISLQNGQMILPNHAPINVPDGIRSTSQLMHPYFWSGYTVVGNWN